MHFARIGYEFSLVNMLVFMMNVWICININIYIMQHMFCI